MLSIYVLDVVFGEVVFEFYNDFIRDPLYSPGSSELGSTAGVGKLQQQKSC